jgi:type IV pilus assembly protein PilF
MTEGKAPRGALRACWTMAWLPWVVVLALQACSTATAPQGAAADIVTPSDETDARRRARIRLELAVGYFETGKVAFALDEVKQALVNDPGFADAYNLRGLIYMQLRDLPMADESFRRALSVRPGDANVLHNHAWLLCLQQKYDEADKRFAEVLANPGHTGRTKSLMAQGLCQARAGDLVQAEKTFLRAYELDTANPVVGYNLADIFFRKGELTRAQFYIRRINNSEFANAETLWLGVKVEKALNDTVAMRQLSEQLRKRFPQSKETAALERGAFNE